MIAQADIEKVLEGNELVSLVNQYLTRPLRRAGVQYVAPCPFHKETEPSFTVHPSRQFYYCHGCHAGGNAINFVRRIEGLSWPAAVKLLADRAGIDLQDGRGWQDAYAQMIAAEAAWFWRTVLQAYRKRHMHFLMAYDFYSDRSLRFQDHDLQFWQMSEAIRASRRASRWLRIITRTEQMSHEMLFKKYQYFRTRHPEIVRIYREHIDFENALNAVFQAAALRVGTLTLPQFHQLIDVIHNNLSCSVSQM